MGGTGGAAGNAGGSGPPLNCSAAPPSGGDVEVVGGQSGGDGAHGLGDREAGLEQAGTVGLVVALGRGRVAVERPHG